jgi:hypothetical protein
MTDLAAARENGVSEGLRNQITGIIRKDLADEADAGFPLLQRFPNSETAGVPQHFSRLRRHERESLLDALAHYAMIKWSHDVVREKRAHPVLGPYLAKQPVYPPGDWYGARPKKMAIKHAVLEALTGAGFTPRKRKDERPSHVVAFAHPDAAFPGDLIVSFDPGLLRQIDFGFRDWLRPELGAVLPPLGPRDFVPVVGWLAYDHLWHGAGTNNPVCWDLITEQNLAESVAALGEALARLGALAGRVNALAAAP